MFKIVEIVEDNKIQLCVVPESWEKDGILYWPPGRKGMSLRKDANNLPNYHRWSKQDCSVRKHSIKSFKEANELERYLAQFSDTEDEEK